MSVVFFIVGICLLCSGNLGWGILCLVLAAVVD